MSDLMEMFLEARDHNGEAVYVDEKGRSLKPRFGIGAWRGENGWGMQHGPFEDLLELLEIPGEKGQYIVALFGGEAEDRPMYRWCGQRWEDANGVVHPMDLHIPKAEEKPPPTSDSCMKFMEKWTPLYDDKGPIVPFEMIGDMTDLICEEWHKERKRCADIVRRLGYSEVADKLLK